MEKEIRRGDAAAAHTRSHQEKRGMGQRLPTSCKSLVLGSKSFISRSVAAKEPWSGTFKALSDRTPRLWTQDRKCFTRETLWRDRSKVLYAAASSHPFLVRYVIHWLALLVVVAMAQVLAPPGRTIRDPSIPWPGMDRELALVGDSRPCTER